MKNKKIFFVVITTLTALFSANSFAADTIPPSGIFPSGTFPSGTAPCKGTLTGPVSYTFDCIVSAGFKNSKNQTLIGFTVQTEPQGISRMAFALTLSGEPTVQSYDASQVVNYADSVMTTDSHVYAASNKSFQGTQELKLSSVDTQYSTDSDKLYTIHGSYDALLKGVYPSGGDPLTVHIDF